MRVHSLAEVQQHFDRALQHGRADAAQYWAGWRDALITMRIAGMLQPMTAEEAVGGIYPKP